jgi:hypothetical protein
VKINRSCALVYREIEKFQFAEPSRCNRRDSTLSARKSNEHKACNRDTIKVSGASSVGMFFNAGSKDREVASLPL